MQQVNFVVFSILMVLSAVGWRQLLTPGRAAIGFPLFQSLSGLGLIVLGLFSLDPLAGYPPGAISTATTVQGTIHGDVARLVILFLACGCFVVARRFAIEPRWRRWATYSVITGVLILVFFVLFLDTFGSGLPAGLFERVSAVSHALWSCVHTGTLLFHTRTRRG